MDRDDKALPTCPFPQPMPAPLEAVKAGFLPQPWTPSRVNTVVVVCVVYA